ncbi:hypothetical protein WKI68_02895 [Streptomyces sp. MS1.HAVA.3]|uniref:Uncharacterized protein n=1 Tax=Streptomyces caledonius TaxID=3134107 RepID=A0ABU8TZZ1_9ACTN
MKLFDDPGLNFAGLLALGAAGMRASEVGEVLTAVNAINTAGPSEQTFSDTFRAWGDRLAAPRPPAGTATGPLADPPLPLPARRPVLRPVAVPRARHRPTR